MNAAILTLFLGIDDRKYVYDLEPIERSVLMGSHQPKVAVLVRIES